MNIPLPMPYAVAPVPGRITAAMCFIQHCQTVMWGPCVPSLAGEEWKSKGGARDLSEAEQAAYETALGALIEYFDSPDAQQGPAPTSTPPSESGTPAPINPAFN